jgi:hypothetical protein
MCALVGGSGNASNSGGGGIEGGRGKDSKVDCEFRWLKLFSDFTEASFEEAGGKGWLGGGGYSGFWNCFVERGEVVTPCSAMRDDLLLFGGDMEEAIVVEDTGKRVEDKEPEEMGKRPAEELGSLASAKVLMVLLRSGLLGSTAPYSSSGSS